MFLYTKTLLCEADRLAEPHYPVGLNLKSYPMKRKNFNPGGRPRQEIVDNRSYIVSTRLNTFEHLKLQELISDSGKAPAVILRELVSRG